ncbi:hypothetical protein C7377_0278 [Balneicella halophila]|uniref:Adhesin n=1 Tax=Balneicella halophila TaxID=1537566 RepID=A0A7L4UQG0_BALHA|nr:hypothetical protein [Balneicella halophila]PVX51983.1 hypothetical protein C7377_0278 [Balneicella halophila]
MKKLIGILLVLCSITVTNAKEETITKTIDATGIEILKIDSKYGKIIIENWDKQEIAIEAIISAQSKKEETMEKMLRNVSVKINDKGNYLDVSTNFGTFFSFIKFSNKLFNNGDFSIDYYIKMPNNISLDISLHNGDIILYERDADVRLNHSSGYISSQTIHGKSSFELKDSHLKISQVGDLSFNTRNSSLMIEKANLLKGESYNSKLEIGEVGTFDAKSMRDEFNLRQASQIIVNSTLTDIVVDRLDMSGILNPDYGSVTIKEITPNFDELKMNSKGAQVSVFLGDTPANIAISHHSSTKMLIPENLGINMRFGETQKDFITTGTIGDPTAPSQILINARGGSLQLQ